jgi:hypothetical protein
MALDFLGNNALTVHSLAGGENLGPGGSENETAVDGL